MNQKTAKLLNKFAEKKAFTKKEIKELKSKYYAMGRWERFEFKKMINRVLKEK